MIADRWSMTRLFLLLVGSRFWKTVSENVDLMVLQSPVSLTSSGPLLLGSTLSSQFGTVYIS
jgi:hypothetical protein